MPLPRPPKPPNWRPKKPPKLPGQINVNIPGYTPDWKALIENDPTFSQFKGRLGNQSLAEKASRNAAIRQALIGFGGLPSLEGIDLGDFGIDEETRRAILANTNPNTSTAAGLQRKHESNVQDLQDMLAAKGMLRSGSLGVGLNQEQERYAGAQTTERTKLLDFLKGLQKAFSDAEGDRYEQLYGPGGLAEKTEKELIDSGLYKSTEAQTVKAVKDPATGLYKDANGNYYDRNGNPVRDPTKKPGFAASAAAQRGIRRRPPPGRPQPPYAPGYRP